MRAEPAQETAGASVKGELPGILRQAVEQRLFGRRGLLVDFLEHEMGEAFFLGRGEVPRHQRRPARDGAPIERGDLRACGRQLHHFVVVEIDDPARPGQDRRHVAGEERLPLPQPDDQRAAGARAVEMLRLARGKEDHRVGAAEFLQGASERLGQGSAFRLFFHQVGDDLRVGLRAELVALRLQPRLQLGVILHDAVVHDGQAPGTVGVRVRVDLRRGAVGRPSVMAHRDVPVKGVPLEGFAQTLKLADALAHVEPLPVEDRQAG